MDNFDCFHVSAIVNSAAVNIGVRVSFQWRVFSGYTPGSGISGSRCSLILVFWGTSVLVFHSECTSLYAHWQCGRVPFSHTLSGFVLIFLMMAVLTRGRWYLTVVLICIPPVVSNVEHLFTCFLGICMSSSEKCLLGFSTCFSLGLFGFWVALDVCVFWKVNPCQSHPTDVFSQGVGCLFFVIYGFLSCRKACEFDQVPFVYFCFYF